MNHRIYYLAIFILLISIVGCAEILKMSGEGVENYAGRRAKEDEITTQAVYNEKLKMLNITRCESLRKKINNGTATPEEVKEYKELMEQDKK